MLGIWQIICTGYPNIIRISGACVQEPNLECKLRVYSAWCSDLKHTTPVWRYSISLKPLVQFNSWIFVVVVVIHHTQKTAS
jgi:hypothetical protein